MQCHATASNPQNVSLQNSDSLGWLTYNLHGHLVSVGGSIVQRGVAITVGREGTVAIQVTKEMSDTTVGH